jgi:hypothetical protein
MRMGAGEWLRQMLRIAADVVLTLHVGVVLFAVMGGLLILVHPLYAAAHVPIVIWCSVVNLMDWTCPLTPLETRLRKSAGDDGYEGGCLTHYLEFLVRPLGMPRRLELVAGVSIAVWNALLYAVLLV